jgi:hypothetical protein
LRQRRRRHPAGRTAADDQDAHRFWVNCLQVALPDDDLPFWNRAIVTGSGKDAIVT